MCERKKIFNTVLALLVMFAVFQFAGCRDITETILAEIIERGGLTDEEFDAIISGGSGQSYTVVEGTGTLVSLGPSVTGVTYYIDAENGNDAFNGRSPLTPWRSFRNANARTFLPGDHILLEANSIWNGTSVNQDNLNTLLHSSEVGMLWPKGSGSYQNHIVIDLYQIEGFGTADPKVSFRANQRPIINGNGTPATGSNRWFPSGAITLLNQHHWRIRNIEATNTFKDYLVEPNHWYDTGVPKHLCGIMIMGWGDTRNNPDFRQVVNPEEDSTYNIIVENCYVHDVQSMHQNNGALGGGTGIFGNSQALGGGQANPVFKVVGGIIVYGLPNYDTGAAVSNNDRFFGYNGMLLQNNIVKRVGMEGLRNKSIPDGSGYSNSNVVFRGNYLEHIFGDGIVIDGIQRDNATNARGNYMNGLVESNVIKDSCAAPNTGTANYAAVWAMTCYDTTFQFNEAYGTVYGWNDGEAWDIDNGSDKVIYQFNYSHHNAGGAILFMSSITDGVFRYNISANDGAGTRWMQQSGLDPDANTNSNSFTSWQNGQCLFHYTNAGQTPDRSKPLIYNNTFFIGDGITVGVFGNNTNSPVNRYVRFYNNILLKSGTGTVYLSYGQSNAGHPGNIHNPAGFRNNILWAYDSAGAANPNGFNNGSQTMVPILGAGNVGVNGNKWVDPRLQIQQPGKEAALRAQRYSKFDEEFYTDPAKLAAFTSKERLRSRAGMFTPIDDQSPAIGAGMFIPRGPTGMAEIDTAWNNGHIVTEDMFGAAVNWNNPPIGAAAAPYISTYVDPFEPL